MHLLAERCILKGLKAAGVVTGDVDQMLSARVGALFMPHGAMQLPHVPVYVDVLLTNRLKHAGITAHGIWSACPSPDNSRIRNLATVLTHTCKHLLQ